MDVDDESDLRALLEHDLTGTETGRWLRKTGVDTKFCGSGEARAKFAARG
jgi:hypothetical protein